MEQTATKTRLLVLIALWLIVTAININKAFHIDDTFHLESALWIAQHPEKPMSGDVIWYDNPEKFRNHNQPALLFYLITFTGEMFGYSEIPLHLLLSVFTFLALYFFDRVLRLLSAPYSGLLLALFALCPAFIINQNLMTDIPILALEIAFIYYLLKAGIENDTRQYNKSGIALGAALLIKYSIIPLLPVMALAIVLNKHYKQLFKLLIPLGMLALWAIFNKLEYGGIHLMDRPKNELSFEKVFDQTLVFAACIGAVAPFAMAFIFRASQKKLFLYVYALLIITFSIFAACVYHGIIPENFSSGALNKVFMINGFLLIGCLLSKMAKSLIHMKKTGIADKTQLILFAWAIFMSGFMILYAPFMATRHILLVLPCILIIGIPFFEKAGKTILQQAVICTGILGLLLGISDWQQADFYRDMAREVQVPGEAKIWSSGHWGWQWYSKERMLTYSTDSAQVKAGDYIVYPRGISKQRIHDSLELTEHGRVSEPSDLSTFFSGKKFASLYNAYTYKGSWNLSRQAIDTIIVSRISRVKPLLPPDTTAR